MILLINYYIDKNRTRQAELLKCLENNIGNPLIDNVVVFHEPGVVPPDNSKVISVVHQGRPTYQQFFEYGNNFSGIKIVSNTDICFNNTLEQASRIRPGEVYALTRWDEGNPPRFYGKTNSQDVWIWRGSVNVTAGFPLGKAGCDNSIAYILYAAGYSVRNPSLSIQCIHVHQSLIRNYSENDKVPQPYAFLKFHTIDDPVKYNVVVKNTWTRISKTHDMKKKTAVSEAIDVVYVLGRGSKWKNNEIRFSLRSVEKNLTGYRNIYVVGENPVFLQGVIHIPYPDEIGPQNADGNIACKVLRACQEKDLSDDFLFINDDHLILKPMEASLIPAFHKGDMNDYPEKHWTNNLWRRRLKRTRDVLNRKGLPAFNYDCHVPILFNKHSFPKVLEMFDFREDIGYTMKSMYGNVVHQESGNLLGGEKRTVFQFMQTGQIESRLRGCDFMSFNDEGLNAHLKKWLWLKFPLRSRYETNDVQDFYVEALAWVNGDRNFQEGAMLFAKYIRRSNINKLFNTGETPALREKLEFKFDLILRDYERA